MRKLSTLLIIAGLIIGCYPIMDRAYTCYRQRQLLKQYQLPEQLGQETQKIGASEEATRDYRALAAAFEEDVFKDKEFAVSAGGEDAMQEQTAAATAAIGYLQIDKIDLNLPILEGADEENLKIGAARLAGTAELGGVGNVAMAAHRSHTFGSLFNRLAEVELGDKIIVETKEGHYEYTVSNKQVVEPTDTSVLSSNSRDKILTLVTCEPMVNPTHRLIIQGIIK